MFLSAKEEQKETCGDIKHKQTVKRPKEINDILGFVCFLKKNSYVVFSHFCRFITTNCRYNLSPKSTDIIIVVKYFSFLFFFRNMSNNHQFEYIPANIFEHLVSLRYLWVCSVTLKKFDLFIWCVCYSKSVILCPTQITCVASVKAACSELCTCDCTPVSACIRRDTG